VAASVFAIVGLSFLALDPFHTVTFTVIEGAPNNNASRLAEMISDMIFIVMLVTLVGGLGWAGFQTIKQRKQKRD